MAIEKKKKIVAAITGASAAVALGLGGLVIAQTANAATPAPAESSVTEDNGADGETADDNGAGNGADGETADDNGEASIQGSIAAPAEADDTAEAQQSAADEAAADAAEAAALEGLATVSSDEAAAAAVAAVPGSAGKVTLENEDGFVVYSVEVTATDGTVTEVIVDAGTAQVLAQNAGGADGETNDDGSSTPSN